MASNLDQFRNSEKYAIFKELFDEFASDFLQSNKGKRHINLAIKSRQHAKINIAEVNEAFRNGQDITNLILIKLLPHQDSPFNKNRNAWTHVAPAITKDIKLWFSNISYYTDKNWDKLAAAIFNFINHCIENPLDLEVECQKFNDISDTKGVQSGFLTPFLNALNPDNFLVINKKPVLLINYFADVSLSANLLDYPEINKVGLSLLEQTLPLIQAVTPPEIHVTDVFDMFSHWLKAKKKYWNIGFYQIAPGERARLWEDFLQSSIAAVGWGEIDYDIGNLKKNELYQHYEKCMPDSTDMQIKQGVAMLWHFLNMKPGDKILTNKGRSFLIGIGEVTSGYKFRPERNEYKHTVDVEYSRLSEDGISIPDKYKGKFGRTINKFDRSVFEEMERMFGDGPIPPDENGVKYWTYSPGKEGKYWDDLYDQGLLSIGWDFMGDLKQYETKEEMLQPMEAKYGEGSSFKNRILACYEFASVMKPGDVVFAKIGTSKLLGYGVVQSEYKFDNSRENHKHIRVIDWKKRGSWDISDNKVALKTLTDVTAYPDFISQLTRLVKGAPPVVDPADSYDIEKELKEIFVPDTKFLEILDLLKYKKNLVLQGPPGVGKTFIARHIAWAVMKKRDNQRIGMVQFHQSYSYEDFVQGFRPDENGGFFLKDGLFYKFCKKAALDKGNEYFFIIDEINRGNLSKIFGELMMLIEPDKRETYAIPLTYSKNLEESFTVPANLYLIGTMNTADRSLAMVDYALRRRFCFVDLAPAFGSAKFSKFLSERGVPSDLVAKIKKRLENINTIIADDSKNLGSGFCIGHSYFCDTNSDVEFDINWYNRIVDFEIGPLLSEYWFDNPEKANQQIEALKI